MNYIFMLPSPDYSKGFGGKYGVDKEKVDKSAVGFEYQGKTEKHESQKGFYLNFHSVMFCLSGTSLKLVLLGHSKLPA